MSRPAEHPLADAAVEALGGTPASIRRRPVAPVRAVLPPGLARRVGALDATIDRAFAEHLRGRPLADAVFYGASALGDFSLIWHLVSAATALRSEEDERAAIRLSIALGVESVLVNWGVKSLFRRARPVTDRPRPLRLRNPRTSSFPSGHATSGFMAATLLAQRRGPLAPVWYTVAAVVAASRVHVRIHHPSDVLGGVLVGVALGRLVHRAWPLTTDRADGGEGLRPSRG